MATLDQVIEELQIQNQKLDTVGEGITMVVKSIGDQIAAGKRAAGDSLEERLDKQRDVSSSAATSFKGGLIGAVKADTGIDFLSRVAQWAFGGITGALGALGAGKFIGLLLPAMGAMVGRLLTRGPLAAAMLLFGEELITKSFDGLEEYITISQDDKKLYAASMSNALTTGLVLSIFNKKLGIAAFFGSLLADSIKSVFPADMEWAEKQKLFGLEMPFTKENFLEYGAIISSFFAPSLIMGAIRSGLGIVAGGPPGTKAEPGAAQRKAFMKGFKPPGFKGLGWAGLLTFTGSILADWAAEKTGSQKIGELVKIGLTGVTLLALFGTGPVGIAAAVAGVAIHGLMLIKKRMDEKQAELDAEFKKKVDFHEAKIEEMSTTEFQKFSTMVAIGAGKNAATGRRTEDQAAEEEALIKYLERTNPDRLAALDISQNISFDLEEYKTLKAMGSPAAKLAGVNLNKLFEDYKILTGRASPLYNEFTDELGYTGNTSPFATAYVNSANAGDVLQDGNLSGHHSALPPVSVTGGDVNNTTTYNNSGVVLDQGGPTSWDQFMGGGVHPFSSMYARGW